MNAARKKAKLDCQDEEPEERLLVDRHPARVDPFAGDLPADGGQHVDVVGEVDHAAEEDRRQQRQDEQQQGEARLPQIGQSEARATVQMRKRPVRRSPLQPR